MTRNLVRKEEIGIGDLVKTSKGEVGIVTDISNHGICLSTIDDDIEIFCKDNNVVVEVKYE